MFGDPGLFGNKLCVLEALSTTGATGGKASFLKVRRQRFPALLIAIDCSTTAS